MAKKRTSKKDTPDVEIMPIEFDARPGASRHLAMRFTGKNEDAIAAWAGEDVLVNGDGSMAVVTTEGTMGLEPGAYLAQDAAGNFYPCSAEIHERKYAPADEVEAKPKAGSAVTLADATPRQLIHALDNRLGRVMAIQKRKYPQAVVLQQDLREHLRALQDLGVLLDDTRT